MDINITECLQYPSRGWSFIAGHKKCKYLEKGAFGGYYCKMGHKIDPVPKASKDNEVCRDKEIIKSTR
jgi:hypothetical protein